MTNALKLAGKRVRILVGAGALALAGGCADQPPLPNPGIPYQGPDAPAKHTPSTRMYAPLPEPVLKTEPPPHPGGNAPYYAVPGSEAPAPAKTEN